MMRVLEAIPSVTTYDQQIETRTTVSGRTLDIAGNYAVDYPDHAYAAYSTTTLVIDGVPHSFTHANIAVGDDVYLRIDTDDPLLARSINRIPFWTHYTAGKIPPQLSGIAIAGPIEDTLQILGANGAYLHLIRHSGTHYTFVLSGISPKDGGALTALMTRIATGTVDVWIDPAHDTVTQIVFTSLPFVSTSTITQVNAPLTITPPASAR